MQSSYSLVRMPSFSVENVYCVCVCVCDGVWENKMHQQLTAIEKETCQKKKSNLVSHAIPPAPTGGFWFSPMYGGKGERELICTQQQQEKETERKDLAYSHVMWTDNSMQRVGSCDSGAGNLETLVQGSESSHLRLQCIDGFLRIEREKKLSWWE